MSALASRPSLILFRAFIFVCGLIAVYSGIDIGFGGILSLGMQTGGEFLSVTDAGVFTQQDNHVRFVGGVWLGLGFVILLCALRPAQMKQTLYAIIFAVWVGGLARLSIGDIDVIAGPDAIGSVLLEVVGMPLVAFWLSRLRLA